MKKEYILLFSSALVSVGIAAGTFRFLFPALFSVPSDLQVVQLDKKAAPFFEAPFQTQNEAFTLKDPITNIRGLPLYPESKYLGPHDILGFRNTNVPNIADVITIGDSQTYGINASLTTSWPGGVAKAIKPLRLYNMSLGGFSPLQYLYLFKKSLRLRPQVVVIALYSGNDPLEAFITAYSIDYWKSKRPDPELEVTDGPKIVFPPPKGDIWSVTFSDRTTVDFSPKHRLLSHLPKKTSTEAGYRIIFNALKEIGSIAEENNLPVIITVIPTKELAYFKKLSQEAIVPPEEYTLLIKQEQRFIKQCQETIGSSKRVEFVPIVEALQDAVTKYALLYPPDKDGHPLSGGYSVIAKTLFPAIGKHLKKLGNGVYRSKRADSDEVVYFELRNNMRMRLGRQQRAQLAQNSTQVIDVEIRYLEPYPLVESF